MPYVPATRRLGQPVAGGQVHPLFRQRRHHSGGGLYADGDGLSSALLAQLSDGVLWNFTFNRRYTFRSDAGVVRSMLLVALFYVLFTPASTWWGHVLTTAGWNDFLVLAGTMVVNFVTEFLYQRFVVYRNRIDTNDVARRAGGRVEG